MELANSTANSSENKNTKALKNNKCYISALNILRKLAEEHPEEYEQLEKKQQLSTYL